MTFDPIRGVVFSTFSDNLWISWKTAEPRFCETLQCFHHILGDMTFPESIIKQKTDPSGTSVILGMNKTGPSRFFQDFGCNVGTISESISQLFHESFSSTQKCKEGKWRSLARGGYPGRIKEEGGTRRHPPVVFPPSPGDVWDPILYKTLHQFIFGYHLVYVFYAKFEPDASKRGPWDDPGAPLTLNTNKLQK